MFICADIPHFLLITMSGHYHIRHYHIIILVHRHIDTLTH